MAGIPDIPVPGRPTPAWQIWTGAGIIIAFGLVIYASSFAGVFVFDDGPAITGKQGMWRNASLWDIMLRQGQTPVLALTLAMNFRWQDVRREIDPWGYHLFNLTVHVLAALTLFGIVRRTLLTERLRGRTGHAAMPLALVAALAWMTHPLQTEAVTYVIQRKESLMGLFFLLTLYCFIRAGDSRRRRWWLAASVASCLLGMGTKQVTVVAPVLVLMYDAIFLSPSLRGALRRNWPWYLLLALTWLVLLTSMQRFQEEGMGLNEKFTPANYAKSQFGVILHYLRLAFWPNALCLDYYWPVAASAGDYVPQGLVVLALAAGVLVLLWRAPAIGFAGAWFFAALAPTSSVIVITELCFEHRMYLPLAGLAALVVVGGYVGLERLLCRAGASRRLRQLAVAGSACAATGAICLLGWLTVQRNRVYHSGIAVWVDVVAKRPQNPRGQYNLGWLYFKEARFEDAMAQYDKALALKEEYAEAWNSKANVFARWKRLDEAVRCGRRAVEIVPNVAVPRVNLANFLAQHAQEFLGSAEQSRRALAIAEMNEAIAHYERAIELAPEYEEARFGYGLTLQDLSARSSEPFARPASGRSFEQEAVEQFRRATQLRPRHLEAFLHLGTVLVAMNRLDEAAETYRSAIRLKHDNGDARLGLAGVLFRQGRYQEAADEYETALRLNPMLPGARERLSLTREQLARQVRDAPPTPTGGTDWMPDSLHRPN